MMAKTPASIPREKSDVAGLRDEVARLAAEVARLAAEVEALKRDRPGALVPVQTFAPEPYDLLKSLLVVVRADEDEATADFPDANLTACGDNEYEAVEALKARLLDTLDHFSAHPRLGPGPAKQLAVLREFIRRRG